MRAQDGLVRQQLSEVSEAERLILQPALLRGGGDSLQIQATRLRLHLHYCHYWPHWVINMKSVLFPSFKYKRVLREQETICPTLGLPLS